MYAHMYYSYQWQVEQMQHAKILTADLNYAYDLYLVIDMVVYINSFTLVCKRALTCNNKCVTHQIEFQQCCAT